MTLDHDTRVGAYGVIVEDGRILLAHWNAKGTANWTLPGGGLQPGEDPTAAAVREVLEETGHHVKLLGLLGTHSEHFEAGAVSARPMHSLRLLYRARIVGGALRHETDGTTDEARWFDLDEVPRLERVALVDAGVRLWCRAAPR